MTTQNTSTNLPSLNTHLKFGNVDVTNLDLEEVVNITFLLDTSGSMNQELHGSSKKVIDEANEQVMSFVKWMQEWKQRDKLFLSTGRFDSDIEPLSGLQQVNNVLWKPLPANGGSTHLYEACFEFLKNMLNQQQQALQAGILSKSIFFVITDGGDTTGKVSVAADVKRLIDYVNSDESLIGTFVSALVGVGEDSSIFEDAKDKMGFQKLFVIDPGKSEKQNKASFKEVFGWLSASVSSASTVPGALVI